jgi:ureidoglycolate hydrolase
VAPGTTSFGQAGNAREIRAFLLRPLETVVLHRGTWHWGPYPVRADEVRLLNVQGHRYREDNRQVDLAAMGASVDVAVR